MNLRVRRVHEVFDMVATLDQWEKGRQCRRSTGFV